MKCIQSRVKIVKESLETLGNKIETRPRERCLFYNYACKESGSLSPREETPLQFCSCIILKRQ